MSLQIQPLRDAISDGRGTLKVNWGQSERRHRLVAAHDPRPWLDGGRVGEAALARGSEMAALGDIKASLDWTRQVLDRRCC